MKPTPAQLRDTYGISRPTPCRPARQIDCPTPRPLVRSSSSAWFWEGIGMAVGVVLLSIAAVMGLVTIRKKK
jgi:hypothetical protein